MADQRGRETYSLSQLEPGLQHSEASTLLLSCFPSLPGGFWWQFASLPCISLLGFRTNETPQALLSKERFPQWIHRVYEGSTLREHKHWREQGLGASSSILSWSCFYKDICSFSPVTSAHAELWAALMPGIDRAFWSSVESTPATEGLHSLQQSTLFQKEVVSMPKTHC